MHLARRPPPDKQLPPACRDLVRKRQITVEDGTTMRSLLFLPGGLELHIGVSPG